MTRVSSFISNFKIRGSRCVRYLRRGLFCLLWAAVFFTGVHLLNYLYVEGDDWARIMWHHYYAQEQNIDCLYVGSSHVYCDIDPFQLDAINGKNNFNLSVAGQRLNGSYYMLREASGQHDLEQVYLELYYDMTAGTGRRYHDYDAVQRNQWSADYMETSLNKVLYILDMSEPEQYAETLFPFIRYRSKLFDYEYVKDMIRYKETEEYKNYLYHSGSVSYLDKGFFKNTWQMPEKELCWRDETYRMEQDPLTEDAERYLRKIIEYCQEKRIGITLFSSPIYELQVLSTEHYDRYVEQIERIAEEYGIEYYDFNLCREELLPIQKTENFMNIGHLNARGAAVYTPVFWQVMSNTAEENEAYFYPSYDEKLRETPPQIYGIYLADKEMSAAADSVAVAAECAAAVANSNAAAGDEDMAETDRDFGVTVYRVAANRPRDMEYSITLTPKADDETANDEEETVGTGGSRLGNAASCRDFSANSYFVIPKNTHGTCTVTARLRGQESVLQTLEIAY